MMPRSKPKKTNKTHRNENPTRPMSAREGRIKIRAKAKNERKRDEKSSQIGKRKGKCWKG